MGFYADICDGGLQSGMKNENFKHCGTHSQSNRTLLRTLFLHIISRAEQRALSVGHLMVTTEFLVLPISTSTCSS